MHRKQSSKTLQERFIERARLTKTKKVVLLKQLMAGVKE